MHGRISRRLAALSLLGLLAAVPVFAAQDVWVPVGQPWGGSVDRLVMDPASSSTLYAVSWGKLYKTTSAGSHWDMILSLPADHYNDAIADVEVVPESPGTVYAAGDGQGVFKSTDSGATWTQQQNGLPARFDWASTNVVQLVVDPVNAGVVYAVTLWDGLYKTVDGGATWTGINTGIDSGSGHNLMKEGVYCRLTVDPVDPDVLYLGVTANTVAGIYKSADGGAHWALLSGAPYVAEVSVDPANHQHLYASGSSFYESTDAGVTWNAISGVVQGAFYVRFDPTDPLHIWAGGQSSGYFESHDGGVTWPATAAGHYSFSNDIAVDPNDPTNIYIASYGFGVAHSTDGGANWSAVNQGIGGVWVEQMLTVDNGDIYIGTQESGAYISHDGGFHWDNISEGMGYGGIDNGPVQVNWMVKAKAAGTLYAATSTGPYKTMDGGSHWTRLYSGSAGTGNLPGTQTIAMSSQDDDIVFMSDMRDGLFKTVDGGATWDPVMTGLPTLGGLTEVQALAVDPTNDQIAYAGILVGNGGTQYGLYKTVDGGASWTHLDGLPTGDVLAIAIDPENPQTLYVSGSVVSMYKSADGGQTWSAASDGLDGTWFSNVFVDPNDSDIVYATGILMPVYVSMDAGAHWVTVDQLQPGASKASTQSVQPGHEGRTPAATADQTNITAASVDPNHVALLRGADDHGQIYALEINTGAVVTPGGQGGGSSGGGSAGSGSSGGGGFPLLLVPALLAFLRRRR